MRGAQGRRAPLRAGVGAADARHLRDVLPRAADAVDRQDASSPRCSTRRYAREPFVRRPKKRLPEVVAVAGSNYAEVGFAVGPVAERQAHRHVLLRDRQPDQGRRRPGDPEHEPRARLRREARASRTSGTGRERVRSSSRSAARSSARARPRVLAADLRVARRRRRARRDRPRRRPAGDRAAEAARHRDQAGRRPARHRRRDARRHEDGRRRQAQRRPVRGARRRRRHAGRPARRVRRSSCARRAARRRSYPSAGPEPVDFGFVGDVIGFNLELLERCGPPGTSR